MKDIKEIREIAKRVFNDNMAFYPINEKDLKNEHDAYLKIMESYKNLKPCKHLKANTQNAFKRVTKNLECAEIYCLECHGFIGYALRQIKKIPNQKPKITIVFFSNNPNSYDYRFDNDTTTPQKPQ